MTKDYVKEHMKSPKALQLNYSKELFYIGNGHPQILFAGSVLSACRVPVMIGGQPLLEILLPEQDGGPFRLSGKFYDIAGNLCLEIIENEWRAYVSNWDVDVTAGRIIIRDSFGEKTLELKSVNEKTIAISYIKSIISNRKVFGTTWALSTFDVITGKELNYLQHCLVDGAYCGLYL